METDATVVMTHPPAVPAISRLVAQGQQATDYRLPAQKVLGPALELPDRGGARACFTRWKLRLMWQRLTPHEKFAVMIDRH